MTRPPSISVVIVAWNAGEYLLDCLRSLAAHPPPCEWDAVVIDNSSTDGSPQRAKTEFPWVELIVNETNRGLAPANNQGIRATRGDAILVCNPDVLFRAGCVEALIDVFERHPRAAFAIPKLFHPDGALQPGVGDLPTIGDALRGRRAARQLAADGSQRAFWWDGWAHDEERRVGHGAEAVYLVRRAALAEIGLQDERFVLDWEGIDWAARVAEAGWEVWFTPDAELVHVGGVAIKQATARWVILSHRGIARYLRKHHGLRGLLAQPAVAARAALKLLASTTVPFYDRAQRASGDRAPSAGIRLTGIDQRHPPAPKRGLRKLATRDALRTLRHRPSWFLRNLLQGPEFVLDARHHTGAEAFREVAQPEARAAASALGVTEAEYAAAVDALWMPVFEPDDPLSTWRAWGGREELLRIIGAAVAIMRPRVMVETGVALGFTTATVLRAMERNGIGTLHSIDLPPLLYDPDRSVGAAVPDDVRHRWDLRLGDSRKLLAPLAAAVAPIDIFLHDSIHTYVSQRREYRAVWPHLRKGGVLVSDDVENPAYLQFAEEVGAEPLIVLSPSRRDEDETSAIGLLRKD